MGSDDLVRREAVVRAVRGLGRHGLEADDVLGVLERIPSVREREACWIKPEGVMPPENRGHYECSSCGGWAMKDWKRTWEGTVLTTYCPHCGARLSVRKN